MRKILRRVAFVGVPFCAVICGGTYYKVRYRPLALRRSQPLPPKRMTPLFATGTEGIDDFQLPDGYSKTHFSLLVVYRLTLLIVRAIPVLWYLLLSSIRGKKVILDVEVSPEEADEMKKKKQQHGGGDGSSRKHGARDPQLMVTDSPNAPDLQLELNLNILSGGADDSDGSKVEKVKGDGQEQEKSPQKYRTLFNWELCPREVAYDRFLQLLKDMGPSYIKLGQWMATRPDIFPDDLMTSLGELFDAAPPHEWSHTERELRRSGLLEHVQDVSKECISSGSIAQVYTATLKHDVLVAPETIDADDADPTPPSKRLTEEPMLVRAVERVLHVFGWSPHQVRPDRDEVLLKAGTRVAIKLAHPELVPTMLADIAAMKAGASLLSRLPGMDCFALETTASEFAALLLSQLDFRRECDNLLRFRYNFRSESGVVFPLPVPQLTSPTILVETFEEGIPCQKVSRSTEIADVGCRMFLKMLFEDNFVHADLHPGNLLVRYRQPDGTVSATRSTPAPNSACNMSATAWSGVCDRLRHWYHFFAVRGGEGSHRFFGKKESAEVVVLDAGLITSLSKQDRENFIALFSAVACGDGELGARLMMERSPNAKDCRDVKAFATDMRHIFDTVGPGSLHGFSLGEVEMGSVLQDIFRVLRKHQVRIDGNFTTLVATVIIGEGLGRRMQPDYNIFGESIPYLMTCLENHELSYLMEALHRAYGPAAFLPIGH